jgi:cytochrome c biogenesis protein CcmG/thiol:disulfide interchange protein DsbE
MRKRSPIALSLAAVLVGLLLVSWAAAKEEGEQPAQEQKKLPLAPDFQLKNLTGERVALQDLLGQGPVLISFWATWCKPCLKELPHIQELYDKYRDRGVLAVAISEDAPRSISKVRSYIAGNKYDFLVLLDENNGVQRKFNFRAVPYSVILDKEGHIVYSRMGYRPGDEQVLEEKLLPLLEKEQQEGMTEEEKEEQGSKEVSGTKEIQNDQGEAEQERSEEAEAKERTTGENVKKVNKDWAKTRSAEGHDE